MFPDLPSWSTDIGISDQCEAEEIARVLGAAGGIMHDATSSSPDSSLPAAYTFFSQFVDHDITLDTTTALHGRELGEVKDLPNMRSASLDLDCVYGFGPEVMPFLYDQSQPGRMLVGSRQNVNDVPRNSDGRALIGDPRNDENIFVSQLQLLFLQFHNRRIVGRSFEEAQEDVRFHYQWLVLFDFLKRICSKEVYEFALEKILSKEFPLCEIKDDCGRLCMPVEFSGAAYRFGHSMVRSIYPANAEYPVIELFDERFGTLGFSPVPEKFTVDWRFLLNVDPCHEYVASKSIDHLLADELINLPDPVVGKLVPDNDRSLAFRNLLRAYVFGLPSGQRVAQALNDKGYSVTPGLNLEFSGMDGWSCIEGELRTRLEEHTPLFLYVMRESGVAENGNKLGPVGSAILMEVFGAMLVNCHTFLHEKGWQPDPCICKDPGNSKKKAPDFELADLVRYVHT